MQITLTKRQQKIWKNLPKLFKLIAKYERVINEKLVPPRYYPTVFQQQEVVEKNIVRLTKLLIQEDKDVNSDPNTSGNVPTA